MKLMMKFCFLLLLCFPLTSLAEIPEQLKNDFSQINGTIIMPIGEKYLVDLDASVNLREGDILTLISPGEKVIHPETKEVLGTLLQAQGYLQVTQVKSGYSYAKLLTEHISPAKGDKVQRYEQTPVKFKALQPSNNLHEELKLALPHLNWLSETENTKPELIFIFVDNTLKVTTAAGAELTKYQYTNGLLAAPTVGIIQANSFQFGETPQKDKSLLNQAVDNLTSTIGFSGKDKRLNNPGIIQGQQLNDEIWIGPNLNGNPIGIAVADFDGDGQLETAIAMEDHLQIHRMTEGKLLSVENVNFASSIHLLTLDTVDSNADGKSELYLSANAGTSLSSQVIDFKQGHYQNTINRVPWFFRVVNLPQEGSTLIGQTIGEVNNPLSKQPFRVIRSTETIERGSDVSLPTKVNLFNFVEFKEASNNSYYAYLSNDDTLHVSTDEKTSIWESSEPFGGSDVFFYPTDETNNELVQPIYIPQRLTTLSSGEILVPQNDGPRIFTRYRNFDESRIVAFKWNGSVLQESWETSSQNGYLADFTIADADNDGEDELVMVIKFKHKNLLQKGRSSVVIYELNQ